MARPKKTKDEPEKVEKDKKPKLTADKVDEALRKEYGSGCFMGASFFTEKKREIISLGPSLDMLLGGGLLTGSFCVMSGKYKLGKTSLCLHFAKKAQLQGYKVYYLNIEGRLTKRDLEGINGLDLSPNKFEVIGSVKGKILAAEDYLQILMSLLETKEKCLFIVDSVSQLCGAERHASDVGDRIRDSVPLMLANFTRKAANILPVNENILIFITHIYANTSGKGHSMYNESGGNKIQYASDIKVKVTHATAYEVNEQQIGQTMHLVCETSNLGKPGVKTDTLLRYNYGIDEISDLLNLAIDIGVLNKAGGGWITFNPETENEKKVQGVEAAAQYLKDNNKDYLALEKKIKELLS